MGDRVESVAEVKVDNIHGSPFIYPASQVKADGQKNSLCPATPWARHGQPDPAPGSEPRGSPAGREFALVKALQPGAVFLC